MVAGRPGLSELASPPADLPLDGQEFWVEVVPALCEIGMLDRIDRPLLCMLATAWARFVQAGRVVAQDGHFTRGSVGQLKEHPAIKIERESAVEFERLAQSFGLSPLGRVRLGLAQLRGRQLLEEMDAVLGEPSVDDVIDGDDVGLPGA